MDQKKPDLPRSMDMYKPILEALVTLGGSASKDELEEAVSKLIGATQEQLDQTYASNGSSILFVRMSWARSAMKAAALITNPSWGVWVLTDKGRLAVHDAPNVLKQNIDAAVTAAKQQAEENLVPDNLQLHDQSETETEQSVTVSWQAKLLEQVQQITPPAFERLCKRLLREAGFVRVEVTGKPGDGGIDGAGVLRMNLISFQVLFQCKRWKGSVGSELVRNFRGAMQGRADKGIILTTGTFTADARKEATRDGAPAIDLIDGELLCVLLKDHRLGVSVEEVYTEEILVQEGFFSSI